jgi:16S rRNA (guanine527-N7)-methyltransferase
MYIDLLSRWNARVNLTAIRNAEEIVTRHFGESLFAAQSLFPPGQDYTNSVVIDVGSGPGFPGLPIKIWAPEISLTLLEANHKKVAFLREVCRVLTLTNVNVIHGRAEDCSLHSNLVTLRAVEKFIDILPVARRLLAPGGKLALLIGNLQVKEAEQGIEGMLWQAPQALPLSAGRVLLVGAADGNLSG